MKLISSFSSTFLREIGSMGVYRQRGAGGKGKIDTGMRGCGFLKEEAHCKRPRDGST